MSSAVRDFWAYVGAEMGLVDGYQKAEDELQRAFEAGMSLGYVRELRRQLKEARDNDDLESAKDVFNISAGFLADKGLRVDSAQTLPDDIGAGGGAFVEDVTGSVAEGVGGAVGNVVRRGAEGLASGTRLPTWAIGIGLVGAVIALLVLANSAAQVARAIRGGA